MHLAGGRGRGGGRVPQAEYQQITFRTGSIGNARFTPDGSIVYSASWEGGENQLYMSRTDDPGSRELGIKDAELLSISKGGELAIRLNTVGHGGYARSGTLARVPLSGGTPREVLDNVQDADWSADRREHGGGPLPAGKQSLASGVSDRQGADRQHQLDQPSEDFAGWEVGRVCRS